MKLQGKVGEQRKINMMCVVLGCVLVMTGGGWMDGWKARGVEL